MRPADHPEFFTRPPPPGRSRESTLRLDREGRFWHDGELVEHPKMARSFASWLDRHPYDGRFILNNGYDWTYIEVEDAALQVRTLHASSSLTGDASTGQVPPKSPRTQLPDRQGSTSPAADLLQIELSDGSVEILDASSLWLGERDAVYCLVRQGRLPARFTPGAQLALEPYLVLTAEGQVAVRIGGQDHVVSAEAKTRWKPRLS